MEFSERTVILRLGKFREADLWLRLLSPGRGVFSAFAFGGSRSRRRFGGCLDLFNQVLFQCKDNGQEYITLEEGVLLEGPRRLRHDLERLGVAVNCAKFLEAFSQGALKEQEEAETLYNLFVELLSVLEEEEAIPSLLPVFFRAKVAFAQGYALEAGYCHFCGSSLQEKELATFLPVRGVFACPNCAGAAALAGASFPLGTEGRAVLEAILSSTPAKWEPVRFNSRAGQDCAGLLEAFVQHHTGLYWDKGRFARI